jgi:hypothetical protein
LKEGLGVGLPEEAAVFIFVHDLEKSRQRIDLFVWLVAMPLQIAHHPKDPPVILGSDVGRLGKGSFTLDARISEVGSYVEELDALADESVAMIEPIANVNRRSPTFHEGFQITLVPRQFKFGESHIGGFWSSGGVEDNAGGIFDA